MEKVATPLVSTPMFMVLFVLFSVTVCISLFSVRDTIEHHLWHIVGFGNKSLATILSFVVVLSPSAALFYYFSAIY